MKSIYTLRFTFIGTIPHVVQLLLTSTSALAQVHLTDYQYGNWLLQKNVESIIPGDKAQTWTPRNNLQIIATESTVLIQNKRDPTLSGSGVIISKKDNVYVVLTAAHVLDSDEEYTITTSTNTSYMAQKIQKFPNIDLARFQFESNENFEVASLGEFQEVKQLDNIQLAGFPNPEFKHNPSLSIIKGEITAISEEPGLDGYSIIYNAPSHSGMSGGPVFNKYGHIIAIHGRQESNKDGTLSHHGIKLGIPISLYSQALTNAEHQNLNNNQSYAGHEHYWIRLTFISKSKLNPYRNSFLENRVKFSKKKELRKEKKEAAKLKTIQEFKLKQTIQKTIQQEKEHQKSVPKIANPSQPKYTQESRERFLKSSGAKSKSEIQKIMQKFKRK